MANGLAALLVGFGVMMIIGLLALYIYMALVLMTIAQKTKTPNAWLAWIPVANIYLMTDIGKVPGWLAISVLFPLVPYLGLPIFIGVLAWMWWKIAEARGRPGWWGLLIMLLPVVNLILMGILAWGEAKK